MMLASELEQFMSTLSPRQQLTFLLRAGMEAIQILGMQHCAEHVYGRPMHDNEPLTFDMTSKYCVKCCSWFRLP